MSIPDVFTDKDAIKGMCRIPYCHCEDAGKKVVVTQNDSDQQTIQETIFDLENNEITITPFLPPTQNVYKSPIRLWLVNRTEINTLPLALLGYFCRQLPIEVHDTTRNVFYTRPFIMRHVLNVYRYVFDLPQAKTCTFRANPDGFEFIGFDEPPCSPDGSVIERTIWLSYRLLVKKDKSIIKQIGDRKLIVASPIIDIAYEAGVLEELVRAPGFALPTISVEGHERPDTFVVSRETRHNALYYYSKRCKWVQAKNADRNRIPFRIIPRPLQHYEGWQLFSIAPFGAISSYMLHLLGVTEYPAITALSQHLERWPPEMYEHQVSAVRRDPASAWPALIRPEIYGTILSKSATQR